jgi:hypothetical protein
MGIQTSRNSCSLEREDQVSILSIEGWSSQMTDYV